MQDLHDPFRSEMGTLLHAVGCGRGLGRQSWQDEKLPASQSPAAASAMDAATYGGCVYTGCNIMQIAVRGSERQGLQGALKL